MWLDEYVPVLALADTTRPILLIVFIVGLFGVAGLGVVLGRKRVSSQNARAIAKDAGIAKGDVRGGDGTASAAWITSVHEEVDDSPRQSWADVLSLQGIAAAPDDGPSPFAATAQTYDQQPVYQQPVYEQPVYEQPVYEVAPEQPVYEQQPVYEVAPEQPVYEQPVYEQPVYEVAPEQPVYDQQPVYEVAPEQPVYEQPVAPTAPGGEYAAYFGATPPPPPPPPPAEPFNIWSSDEN